MASKNNQLIFLSLFLTTVFFESNAQCSTYTSAVSDVTLQCTGGTQNRSAVAFYPTQNRYYSVNQGAGGNPIELFSMSGGSPLTNASQGVNYNGFWYNDNLGILEGNVSNQTSIVQHSINPVNSYPLGLTFTTGLTGIPSIQSCGQFDPVNDQVIYYNALTLSKYNRITGALMSTIPVTGLPSTSINSTSIIYIGIPGSEVGVYDYINRKVYFINYVTGGYSGFCQLPGSAPSPTTLGLGYANNRVFLFDNLTMCWYGYKVSNKPDMYFSGYNVLCKYQEEWIATWNNNSDISTYTWSPAPPPSNPNSGGLTISQPSQTTIYSVSVTSTAGCSNSSNFVMTVYPMVINNNIFIAGNDSLFCTNLSPVTLTASGQTSYTWTTGVQTNIAVVSPTSTTQYGVFGVDLLGCRSNWKTFTVTVYGAPTVAIVSTHTLICTNETATLTATGANSYTWTNNLNTSTIAVSPTVSSSYSVVGENTIGCKYVEGIWINVGNTPTLVPNGIRFICKNNTNGTFIGVSGASNYTWSTGVEYPTIQIQPTLTTSYSVVGVSVDGCTASAVITVTVSDCLRVEDQGTDVAELKIYPNPTYGAFEVTVNSVSGSALLEIYNFAGQRIYAQEIKGLVSTVDLGSYEPDVYTLIFTESKDKKTVRKIIKQ